MRESAMNQVTRVLVRRLRPEIHALVQKEALVDLCWLTQGSEECAIRITRLGGVVLLCKLLTVAGSKGNVGIQTYAAYVLAMMCQVSPRTAGGAVRAAGGIAALVELLECTTDADCQEAGVAALAYALRVGYASDANRYEAIRNGVAKSLIRLVNSGKRELENAVLYVIASLAMDSGRCAAALKEAKAIEAIMALDLQSEYDNTPSGRAASCALGRLSGRPAQCCMWNGAVISSEGILASHCCLHMKMYPYEPSYVIRRGSRFLEEYNCGNDE